jgi:hypothetical protein
MADDVYVLVLFFSLILGALLPLIPPSARGSVAGAVGGAMAVFACGLRSAAYALGSILLTWAALQLAPRRHHGPLCFACAFGCLFALRLFSAPSKPGHTGPTNALHLIMTLRLASLGFDSADGAIRAGQSAQAVVPLMQYALCYHGLLSGPFVRYSEWAVAMRHPAGPPTAQAWASAARALAGSAASVLVWRIAASLFPYGPMAAADAWWLALPFPQRLAYFYLSSFQQRFRFHACWLLVESAGILARFPNPANVHPVACETSGSPSVLIASWNVSVHRFLKDYVHRRLPIHSRAKRRLATFAVSAVWHGMRPGYYLFFLGVLGMVGVEHLVRAAAASFDPPVDAHGPPFIVAGGKRHGSLQSPASTSYAPGGSGDSTPRRRAVVARVLAHPLSHVLCHFWTMGCLSYFGAAFNVLGFGPTLQLWRALGFYGIWMLLAPAAVAAAVLAARRGVSRPQSTAGGRGQHRD